MTDARMTALEAVAKALTAMQFDGYNLSIDACDALRALDALPAAPTQAQGETVEFSAWEHEDGMVAWYRAGSESDLRPARGWTRLGTTLLPIRATEGGGE